MFRLKKDNPNRVTINIPNRVILRVVLVVVLAFIGLAAIRQASHALTLVFTAFFLALAFNGPVHWVSEHLPGKRRGSRAMATGVSFLVVLLVLVAFLASIVPPLVRQTTTFIDSVPHLLEQTDDPNSALGRFVDRYNLQDDIDRYSKQISDRLGDIGTGAISGIGRFTSSMFSVLTVLVLTFMMLIEGPRWIRFFRDMIPDHQQERVDRLAQGMYRIIKGYVNGQVALATIASVLMLPVLLIVGVSYPAALIVVVFIAGLIPLVGHTIGAVILSIVALFTSPWAALIVLAYYILYQQIENYVVQPRIQANSTNMSPLLVFLAVVIGVSFGGLLGGLVAIPVAGCIRLLLLEYLTAKHLIRSETKKAMLEGKEPNAA